MNIKTFLTALFFLVTLGLSAQSNTEGEAFHLTKQGAHYVFNASINGKADATILLESGIPALLADSAYVFSSGILSDMELIIADKEKLNLAGRVYKITHKANGTVRIGNSTSYIGEVFVLSNYDYGTYEVAVPVMYLHNDLDDSSRIVNLDLGNQNLQMLSRASLNDKKKTYSEGKMNTNTYGTACDRDQHYHRRRDKTKNAQWQFHDRFWQSGIVVPLTSDRRSPKVSCRQRRFGTARCYRSEWRGGGAIHPHKTVPAVRHHFPKRGGCHYQKSAFVYSPRQYRPEIL